MAITASKQRKTRNLEAMRKGYGAVKTSVAIVQGALVSVVEATGRLTNASNATAATFVGVALESGTGNAGGTVGIEYGWNHEELITAKTALTTTYRMCNVAAFDNDQVTTLSAAGTAAVRQYVGVAVDFDSAGDAWVWIGASAVKSAP